MMKSRKKAVLKEVEAERMGNVLGDFGRHIRTSFKYVDKAISAEESRYKDFDSQLTKIMLTAYSHLDRAIVELKSVDNHLDESTHFFLRYTTERCRFCFIDFFKSDGKNFYKTYLLILEHLIRTGYIDEFYYKPIHSEHYYTGKGKKRTYHDYSLRYVPVIKKLVADRYIDENGNLVDF